MKILHISLVLLTAFVVSKANAASPAEARMDKLVGDVLVIARSAPSAEALATTVRPVLEKNLCFETMTRRAVGPGWRQFTDKQRKSAIDLFTTLIIRKYSSNFTPGEQPGVQIAKAIETAPGRIEIPTKLKYKGSMYDVTYRFEESSNWQVTDVVAEGVSLVANYRAQFDAQFKRGGADAVVTSLRTSVENPQ